MPEKLDADKMKWFEYPEKFVVSAETISMGDNNIEAEGWTILSNNLEVQV